MVESHTVFDRSNYLRRISSVVDKDHHNEISHHSELPRNTSWDSLNDSTSIGLQLKVTCDELQDTWKPESSMSDILDYVLPESDEQTYHKVEQFNLLPSEDMSIVLLSNNDCELANNKMSEMESSVSSVLHSSESPALHGSQQTSSAFCYVDSFVEDTEDSLNSFPSQPDLNSFDLFPENSLSNILNSSDNLQGKILYPSLQQLQIEQKLSGEHTVCFDSGRDLESNRNHQNVLRVVEARKHEQFLPSPEIGLPDLTKKHLFPKPYMESFTTAVSDSNDASAVVKNKVIGMWNNVKYGWNVNLGSNFSKISPIIFLGKVFNQKAEYKSDLSVSTVALEQFKMAFYSITWLTYRTKLLPLPVRSLSMDIVCAPSERTTDCGWGCTLRCVQMMLCTALHRHFLGPDWIYTPDVPSAGLYIHRCIIRWFGDVPGYHGESPLSLHRLVSCGQKSLGKQLGDWYTPSNAAIAARNAINEGSEYMPDLQRVAVYATANNIIFVKDVLELCWTPCVCKVSKMAEYAQSHNILSSSTERPSSGGQSNLPSAGSFNSSIVKRDANLSNLRNSENGLKNKEIKRNFLGQKIFSLARSTSHDDSENWNNSVLRGAQPCSESEDALNYSFCEMVNGDALSPPKDHLFHASPQPSLSEKLFGPSSSFKPKCSYLYPYLKSLQRREDGCSKTPHVDVVDRVECQDSSVNDEISQAILEQERLCSVCESWRSLVLIVTVRMGGSSFNSVYESVVTDLLAHPFSIGIVGGKARKAFYFVGFQEDQLIYLDPHTSQDAVFCSSHVLPDLASYHCPSPRKTPLSKVEPSACIGFYCHTRQQFAQLMSDIPAMVTVLEGSLLCPLIELVSSSRQHFEELSTTVGLSNSSDELVINAVSNDEASERSSKREDFQLL